MASYSRDRLFEERANLLRKLEKYEDMHLLDSWNETWSEFVKVNRLLESAL